MFITFILNLMCRLKIPVPLNKQFSQLSVLTLCYNKISVFGLCSDSVREFSSVSSKCVTFLNTNDSPLLPCITQC
jgi:hypothetical protein